MHCGLIHPFCTLSDVSHNTELWAKTGCLADLYIASRMYYHIPNRCLSVAVKCVKDVCQWQLIPLIKYLHFLTDITELGLLRKHTGPCDSYRFCRQQKRKVADLKCPLPVICLIASALVVGILEKVQVVLIVDKPGCSSYNS